MEERMGEKKKKEEISLCLVSALGLLGILTRVRTVNE